MEFLFYFLRLAVLTLGPLAVFGLSVWGCSKLFSRLIGRHAWLIMDVTSIVGTPVHELGHAVMCLPFCHRITRIRLWKPHPKDGFYGYVEHTFVKKNPWARLGNLFIGLGPLFSGLGVVALTMHLCFPGPWQAYLAHTADLVYTGTFPAAQLTKGFFTLFGSLPAAFQVSGWRSTVGLLVILAVCLHITLSWMDLKNSLSAIPLYLALLAVFSAVTYFVIPVHAAVSDHLVLLALRLFALFGLVLCFALCWVLFGAVIRLIRSIL